MSLFDSLWQKRDSQPTLPEPPRQSVIPAINYWRALQLLKKTPFLELWAAAKKEAPGLLSVFLFVLACLVSLVFTVCWCVKKALSLLWCTVSALFGLLVKK